MHVIPFFKLDNDIVQRHWWTGTSLTLMSDPFFQKKRKRSDAQAKGRAGRNSARDSDSEDGLGTGAVDDMDLRHDFDEPVNDTHHETPAEAKVRLAKLYLEGLREKEEDDVDGIDAAAVDRDNIAARLRKDVEETGGRMHIRVAARVAAPVDEDILAVRGHRACVTYARTSDGAGFLYTSDKDGRILQWRLRDGAQVGLVPRQRGYEAETDTMHSATSGAARRRARARLAERGHGAFLGVTELRPGEGHTSSVLALAVSDDGQYLATAGKDKRIGVWSVGPDGRLTWRKALLGHKDAVRSVAFRGGSAELFSASYDRTVKLFDAAQLSYIETLFGHQESIQDLSCLKAERAVTAGGRERTCRLWKIREESQLVFRGGTRSKVHALLEGGDLVDTPMKKNEVQEGSVDCVAMIDDYHFVSGSDNGNLSLWSVAKKKPLFSVQAAHGMDERYSETEGVQRTPRYITSVACLPYGDIFVSGSWDGVVRVWALDDGLRSFRWLCDVRAPGIVNSLQLVTPAIEHMDDYPVVPSQWRRRGGLDAPLMPSQTKGLTVDGTQSKRTTRRAGIQTTQEGRVLGHKESIAPLLIVGLGSEPRADRWIDVPQAQNGALVVPLWLS